MKRNTKSLFLLSLSLAFVCFLACAFILPNNSKVVAGEQNSATESLQMFDDATIRLNAPIGIRFGAKVVNYNQENANTYGMIILPVDYLQTHEISSDYVNAFSNKGVAIVDLACNVLFGDFDGDGTQENYIQGSLVDIKYANLNREFVAIAYAKNSAGEYSYSDLSSVIVPSVLASKDMLEMERGSEEYMTALNFVNGGINQKMGVLEENGYDMAEFALVLNNDQFTVQLGESKKIEVVQEPAMGYHVKYTSSNPEILAVDSDGYLTCVNDGEAEVTVECGLIKTVVNVTAKASPALDGVVESEYYGDDYMHYVMQWGAYKDRGTADVFVSTYTNSNALYMAFEVVGPSVIGADGKLTGSGLVLMAKNAQSGEGKYMRAYANGCIRSCPLDSVISSNNGYTNATNWQDPVNNPCPWFANVSPVDESGYSNGYVMEFCFEFSEYGVSSASELSFALGWISNDGWECGYANNGSLYYFNRVSDSDSTSNYSNSATSATTWWTYEAIESAKISENIRLDGEIDALYTNHITYSSALSSNTAYTSDTTLYWYDDAEKQALYLAFEVQPAKGAGIKNNKWENTPGTAGIVFAISNGTKGVWGRAYATNLSYKAIDSSLANFYSCTNKFVDWIRGNQGNISKTTTQRQVESFVIEMRLDYDDLGVTSSSEIKIMLGGIHSDITSGTLWHYNRVDGTSYSYTATNDATAVGQVANVSGDYYWTLAQLEAEMAKQNA